MNDDAHARGGAAVGMLTALDPWEAALVQDLRRWCSGPDGQAEVYAGYHQTLPHATAQEACRMFEDLIIQLVRCAHRPLVRHDIDCGCMGADEAVFLHLVRTASAGHLTDAALIATLLVGATYAEHVAMLAGHVGETARHARIRTPEYSTNLLRNDARLH